MLFVGIAGAGEFRLVTRAHALAWRKELERRGTCSGYDPEEVVGAGQPV